MRFTYEATRLAVASIALAWGMGSIAQAGVVVSKSTVQGTLSQAVTKNQIQLKTASFDPIADHSLSTFTASEWQSESEELFLIQFQSQLTQGTFDTLRALGAEPKRYVPNNAYLVEMTGAVAQQMQLQPNVRWVGPYQKQFKMDRVLTSMLNSFDFGQKRFDLVMVDKEQRSALMTKIEQLGGVVVNSNAGSILIEAKLDRDQLDRALLLKEVLWAEPTPVIEEDVDNARIQGGADYLGSLTGANQYTGIGIRGHVMEGANPEHQDFQANDHRTKPIGVADTTFASHGQATYGIIFGDGTGNPQARGIIPNAQGLYTSYNAVYSAEEGNTEEGSRYDLVRQLVSEHQVMFQTASWGYSRVYDYTARSAEMDALIFDHDIPITQSQSNAGNRHSRPQAWAKNIISVGAVFHGDNADPSDDKWTEFGASIGPATDGRIKPDLVAYYDDILATSHSEYTQFGGTSGATPIVAGHVGLTLEMWTDGAFENRLPSPQGTRFENRPHFTTTKALMINTASQYEFEGADHHLTRVHQGWGFPDMKTLYESRKGLLIINETDLLTVGLANEYTVEVAANTPELKATMTFADPAGNVAADLDRINDLTLKVTAPDGTIYYGNNGLLEGNYSTAGGEPNTIDTVENVFIKTPAAGTWKVSVEAVEINTDGHIETGDLDADYALVVSGLAVEPPMFTSP